MLRKRIRHLYYVLRSKIRFFVDRKYFSLNYKILDDEGTVEQILKGKSIARFGDGELSLILNDEAIGFQKKDNLLKNALRRVIESPNKKTLVCIPRAFVYRDDLSRNAKSFWIWFLYMNKEKLCDLLRGEVYGNASFTRFYIDQRDKSEATKKIRIFKKIWDNKKVLIVEGEKTRLGVTNDLFENAKVIKRLLVPSRNAFLKYKTILEKATKASKEYDIVLLSIGPTATVLANDLSAKGIQAIDIGHIDVEYEWYRNGAKKKEAVRGKVINAAKNDRSGQLTKEEKEAYEKSIIGVIR